MYSDSNDPMPSLDPPGGLGSLVRVMLGCLAIALGAMAIVLFLGRVLGLSPTLPPSNPPPPTTQRDHP